MTSAGAFRLAIGLLLTAGSLGVLFTALDPIWNGHPAFPTTLLVGAAAGLVLIASAFWSMGRPADLPTGREEQPAGRPSPRRRVLRIVGRVVVTVLAIVLVGVLVWLRPFPAGSSARSALEPECASRRSWSRRAGHSRRGLGIVGAKQAGSAGCTPSPVADDRPDVGRDGVRRMAAAGRPVRWIAGSGQDPIAHQECCARPHPLRPQPHLCALGLILDNVIRPATLDDVDLLAQIHRRSWLAGFSALYGEDVAWKAVETRCSPQRWRAFLATSTVLIADRGLVQFSGDEIERLYVEPEAWGTGLAAELVTTVLERIGSQAVVWSAETAQAQRFYEKVGFSLTGRSRASELAPGVIATDYELVRLANPVTACLPTLPGSPDTVPPWHQRAGQALRSVSARSRLP